MNIRFAKKEDIDSLIKMRWDFTLEYRSNINENEYDSFYEECNDFLLDAITNDNWLIWVAEKDKKIVSHIFIELIHKVPRPGRKTYPFAYMTNVYTLPEFRNQGIGSKLMRELNDWMKKKNYELIIVWPGEESVNFYKRNGFKNCQEPMVNLFYEW